jgi:hypothetical protein
LNEVRIKLDLLFLSFKQPCFIWPSLPKLAWPLLLWINHMCLIIPQLCTHRLLKAYSP